MSYPFLQVASVCALLSAPKREKLLSGLKLGNLSMADVQSLLHWANNRHAALPSHLLAAVLCQNLMKHRSAIL